MVIQTEAGAKDPLHAKKTPLHNVTVGAWVWDDRPTRASYVGQVTCIETLDDGSLKLTIQWHKCKGVAFSTFEFSRSTEFMYLVM